ncbi:uncharacterized protein J3R85_002516 [Psidium guajava]|nr:uncharacterized protein J3R85_002516 [Psidium guajava]
MGIRFASSLRAKKLFIRTVVVARKGASAPLNVPKGFFTANVGEAPKHFGVPITYLSQPSFQNLLSRSEEIYRFDYPMGGLTALCEKVLA